VEFLNFPPVTQSQQRQPCL